MDLSDIQQQLVAYRLEGTKLYREYSQKELEIYKNCMESTFKKSKQTPLNPENKQINFESHKIIPKLSTKQLEYKVSAVEKALEFSFKI